MDPKSSKRCIHYQIYSELLGIAEPPVYLAVRRCLLTERMINLMEQSRESESLAEKLVVYATNGKKFAFVGPDLEAVTQRSCTVRRCKERCTPAYRQNLKYFHIMDLEEAQITCDPVDETTEVVEKQPASDLCLCAKH